MIIITVKYIVIVAFLTICSVHTCIQTFSLLSLQQTIRIYAAVHDYEILLSHIRYEQTESIKFMIYYKFESVEPNSNVQNTILSWS